MAGFNGRRAPNVSQYVANLNAIPDVAGQQDENFNLDSELAQFTNTDFIDFDTANFLDNPVPEYDAGQDEQGKRNGSAHNGIDGKGLDFVNGAFPFPDLNSYLPNDPSSTLSTTIPTTYTPHTNLPSPLYTSFYPTPYPGQKHHLPSPTTSPSSAPSQEPETAASRLAAEEDKRRRNTAASARFRVKKKQREQALEQTAKDLESKAKGLEQRIGQLETENEWLRGLVVEKRGGEREELRLRWKGEGGVEAERRVGEGRKGVGTDGGENV